MKRREFLLNSTLFLSLLTLFSSCSNNKTIHEPNKVSRRKFKDITLPLLSLGCLRLPYKNGVINQEELSKMVDYCINHGINYFDTGYFYGTKQSEIVLANALQKYKREDYYIATKIKPEMTASEGGFEKCFQLQLKKLKTNYVDFYLAHDIKNKESIEKLENTGMEKLLFDYKKEGRIKYVGFSFHGDAKTFEKIVEKCKWDFCYLQVNYYNYCKNYHENKDIINIAQNKGIPIIAMEPLLGGRLANLENKASDILKKDYPNLTPVEFAIKWSASQKGVISVLSGMNSLKQVEENTKYFINFNNFKDTKQTTQKISSEMKELINCTKCGYCLDVCKENVDIINIFSLYNNYKIKNNEQNLKILTEALIQNKKKTSCTLCWQCCKICPQMIKIPDQIEEIIKRVEKKAKIKIV